MLFIILSVTFALIPCTVSEHIFLCDSHSRNELGQSSPDGTGVLLKFQNFLEVRTYT